MPQIPGCSGTYRLSRTEWKLDLCLCGQAKFAGRDVVAEHVELIDAYCEALELAAERGLDECTITVGIFLTDDFCSSVRGLVATSVNVGLSEQGMEFIRATRQALPTAALRDANRSCRMRDTMQLSYIDGQWEYVAVLNQAASP